MMFRCTLSEPALLWIAAHGTHLEHLHVACDATVSDAAVRALALHCRRLKHLCLSGHPRVTEAAVVQLARCCRRLVTFQLPPHTVRPTAAEEVNGTDRVQKFDFLEIK